MVVKKTFNFKYIKMSQDAFWYENSEPLGASGF